MNSDEHHSSEAMQRGGFKYDVAYLKQQ